MPIPLVVIKRYQGQRVTSWGQPATQTNRDPNRDKSYATLRAMSPTNTKTVYQTSLFHTESSLDRLGLLSPTHDQHIEGRLNEGPRLQCKHKYENEAKQNKRNTREIRHGICKPNARRIQVRAWRHLWLVYKCERTSTSLLALGYPLLGPSRHVRAYDCMP